MGWYRGVQCKVCNARIALRRLTEDQEAVVFPQTNGKQLAFGLGCPHCSQNQVFVPGDLLVFYTNKLGNLEAELPQEQAIAQTQKAQNSAARQRPEPSAAAKARWEFVTDGEMLLAEGNWPPLSVQRGAELWKIEKPRNYNQAAFAVSLLEPVPAASSAGFLKTFGVRIDGDGPPEPDVADRVFDRPAVVLFQDLLGWIRALTSQYWIGYKDSGSTESSVSVSVLDQDIETPIAGPIKFGIMYSYGRPLDESTWLSIGAKLSNCERPAPSRLFFCDALADIVGKDTTQAVVALGIACEIEAQTLIDDFVDRQGPVLQAIFHKYLVKRQVVRFEDAIGGLIKELGGDAFKDSQPRAAQLVGELYSMRGQAVHRGKCLYAEGGKKPEKVEINSDHLHKFVDAVEKLFVWSDSQRSKLPSAPLEVGPALPT